MFLRHLILTVVVIACAVMALLVSKLLGANSARSMQMALYFVVAILVAGFLWLNYRKHN